MNKKSKKEGASIPGIGDPAPEFQALTAQGVVNFPVDYKGKWTILFSQPTHYSPDCTRVGMSLDQIEKQFNEVNCELVELEFEGFYSQIVWLRTIKEKIEYERMKEIKMGVPYNRIKMDVAEKYGLINSSQESTESVSTVFFINPKGIIRTIVYCPLNMEKNFHELYKVALALQNEEKIKMDAPKNLRWKDNKTISQPIPQERNDGRKEYTKQEFMYWFY